MKKRREIFRQTGLFLRKYRGYHIWFLTLLVLLGCYEFFKENQAAMNFVVDGVTTPVKRFLAWLCNWNPYSVAELLIYGGIGFGIAFLLKTGWDLIRKPKKGSILYRRVIFLCCFLLTFYTGFCGMWGINYYADSFEEKSGIYGRPASIEELYQLTSFFAARASELALQVERDENGLFAVSREEILRQSGGIYTAAVEQFPFLDGPELRPKKVLFSEMMSYINLTGFLFPYTGEANVNIHSPPCYLPSTIAHELAHQRGVAPEQEANFVAILACTASGNAVYSYSGYLLGYVHLANALYSVSPEKWQKAASLVSNEVWTDLAENREYWKKYETVVSEVSNSINDQMLQSHGQELGVKSYGAVVDLLIAYYMDK